MDQTTGAPRPAASIVIPLWNNVAYTRLCLVRLAVATPPGAYEVVLVDNGSTDATGELLAGLSGDIRIVRNARNLGFARACNQGAEVATGRYLVFLNNDTEPHPGWLEPVVEVLDTEPDVGVVGSKLLFPNGLVQHAGVLVIGDAAGQEIHGYHRLYGAVPDDPMVERRADLQVVTGAALAIRPELFASLGGFDEGYWNGNEDVDLCLKVREAGYRVVYEPRSTLTHHESVSGPERFSKLRENIDRFHERWSGRATLDVVEPGANADSRDHGRVSSANVGSTVLSTRERLRPDAVHVVGYVGPGGRPGYTTRLAAELLDEAGIPHDVSAYHRSWVWDAPPAYSLNGTGGSCGIVVVCAEPDALAHFIVGRGPGFIDDRYIIALWGWPGASVPEIHLDALRMAHEFWVPTAALRTYAAQVSAGTAVTIPAVPGSSPPVRDQLRAVTGTADRLTLTATVDLSSGAPPALSGADGALAISAFRAAFAAEEEVALLVGVSGGRHLPWRVDELVTRTGKDPRIAVLDLDPAGIGGEELAAAGDCHLALLGARGFAPVALAAMQSGSPVVTMTDPANPDVLTARNGYLLDPSPDEAVMVMSMADALRRVVADRDDLRARGELAAADLARRGDRARAVQVVRERVRAGGRLLERLSQVARA